MTKYKKLLLIILLIPTIVKPWGFFSSIEKFKKNNGFICDNIKLLALCIIGEIAHAAYLENKACFKNATDQETAEVLKTAKELDFSDKDIKKIIVKIPKKNSFADWSHKNSDCACNFSTIILGRYNVPELKEAIKDPNVKKFLYAHELCHIKYNHAPKSIFLQYIASVIIVELATRSLDAIIQKLFKIFSKQQKIPAIIQKLLNESWIKFGLQSIPYVLIGKVLEKNADLGAASLGPDVIKGGIKFFEVAKKLEDERKNAVLERFESETSKKLVNFLIETKKFITWLTIDDHPSLETRIKYLKEKLLELENQAKPAQA